MLHCNLLLNLSNNLVKVPSKVHKQIKLSQGLDQELLKIMARGIINRDKWHLSQLVNRNKILEILAQLCNNNNNPKECKYNSKITLAKPSKILSLHLASLHLVLHSCRNLQQDQASLPSPFNKIASLDRYKISSDTHFNPKPSPKLTSQALAVQLDKARVNPHSFSSNPPNQCNQLNKCNQFNPKTCRLNSNQNLMTATNTWSSRKTTHPTTKSSVKQLSLKVLKSLN